MHSQVIVTEGGTGAGVPRWRRGQRGIDCGPRKGLVTRGRPGLVMLLAHTQRRFAHQSFKATIFLPRANPVDINAREPETSSSLYDWQFRQAQRPLFTLHDGPPFAVWFRAGYWGALPGNAC